MGNKKHGALQMMLGFWFISHQKDWKIRVMSEVRTLVQPTRVRLPDVCVVSANEDLDQTPQLTPPLIVIEILSPEDRLARVTNRLEEFLQMGVRNIWLFDPIHRAAYTYSSAGLHLVEQPRLSLPDSPIYLDLAQIFAALD